MYYNQSKRNFKRYNESKSGIHRKNWENLKMNKCPDCGKSLTDAYCQSIDQFRCPCGFVISQLRYKEIVSNMNAQSIEDNYGKEGDYNG